jgi:hypothetical protein
MKIASKTMKQLERDENVLKLIVYSAFIVRPSSMIQAIALFPN